MKLCLAIFSIFLLQAVLAAPSSESSIIDRIPANHEHKWELLVDKDGNTFLVDANPLTSDASVSNLWNAANDVKFLLYTRSNKATPQRLYNNNPTSVKNSNFVATKPTKYIIHGWNNDGNSDVNKLIRDAFIAKTDCNVIVVDWGAGANHLVYSVSKDRIDSVAVVVASFIDFLSKDLKAPVSNALVCGHSLGGQTAGLVGKKVKSGKLPRIVALDPAGPLFSAGNAGGRVDKNDATYVEIIHTNGGTLGMVEQIGDVDMYPNYGSSQPGCGVDLAGSCAHGRAYEFYAESIRNGGFTANRCGSYSEISGKKCSSKGTAKMGGEPINAKTSGVYHLVTNNKAPYSKG